MWVIVAYISNIGSRNIATLDKCFFSQEETIRKARSFKNQCNYHFMVIDNDTKEIIFNTTDNKD